MPSLLNASTRGLERNTRNLPQAMQARGAAQRAQQQLEAQATERDRLAQHQQAQLSLGVLRSEYDTTRDLYMKAIDGGEFDALPVLQRQMTQLQEQMRAMTGVTRPLAPTSPAAPLAPPEAAPILRRQAEMPAEPTDEQPADGNTLPPATNEDIGMRLAMSAQDRKRRAEMAKFFNSVESEVRQGDASVDAVLEMLPVHLGRDPDEEEVAFARRSLSQYAPKVDAGHIDLLARTAIANPASPLLSNLPSVDKRAVMTRMIELGGVPQKGLDPGEMENLAQFDAGLWQLSNLSEAIDGNLDVFGPIVGRLMPWLYFTDPGQRALSVDAKIRLARQTIGKALEGGVLRKEDELKYEKILPTLQDRPELAKVKLQVVARSLKYQRDRYLEIARQQGRYVAKDDWTENPPPIDVNTASLDDLMILSEQWPELEDVIRRRFPDVFTDEIDDE